MDDAAVAEVDRLHPDDRVRSGWPLRMLVFAFTLLAALALFALICMTFDLDSTRGWATAALAHAALLAALAEWQASRLRRATTGSESATGLAVVIFAALALGGLTGSSHGTEKIVGGLGASVVGALAAWRWGFPLLGAASAIAVLVGLHGVFDGRLGIVLGGTVLVAACWPQSTAPRHPPSIRWAFTDAWVVGLVALYLALNWKLIDVGLFSDQGSSGWRLAGAVATVAIPLATLLAGLRLRDKRLLTLGVLFAVASVETLRQYVEVSAWLVLVLGGTAASLVALGLRKWLGERKEVGGFTAEPIFETSASQRIAEAAVTIAVVTPTGAPEKAPERFEGGGGESGGGGASGGY